MSRRLRAPGLCPIGHFGDLVGLFADGGLEVGLPFAALAALVAEVRTGVDAWRTAVEDAGNAVWVDPAVGTTTNDGGAGGPVAEPVGNVWGCAAVERPGEGTVGNGRTPT